MGKARCKVWESLQGTATRYVLKVMALEVTEAQASLVQAHRGTKEQAVAGTKWLTCFSGDTEELLQQIRPGKEASMLCMDCEREWEGIELPPATNEEQGECTVVSPLVESLQVKWGNSDRQLSQHGIHTLFPLAELQAA